MWQELVNKVVKSLLRLDIVSGIENPYREFTYTIPAGASQEIFYTFNFMRVLSLSVANSVTMRFGSSGTATNIVSGGIGYELTASVDRVTITNTSAGAVTISVGLAVGKISDDRLNISGVVTITPDAAAVFDVEPTASAVFNVDASAPNMTSVTDVSCAATSTTTVVTGSATRREVIITNLDAAVTVRLGPSGGTTLANRGTPLAPGQTIILGTQSQISAYNPGAGAVLLAVTTLTD